MPPKSVTSAAAELAAYVAQVRFEDLPDVAIERAKQCLADSVGCVLFGGRFPWSKMVLDLARATGSGGPCIIPGQAGFSLHVPQAALTLGSFAHAFELDSLRKPGTGVHPGATVALPALAMAQALGSSGRDLVTAIVVGCEVLFRIGKATLHSAEKRGFHAPGITGPFGSVAACASLMKLPPEQVGAAFGICGSLSGGLLAFVKAGSGGMVKRLHLGRAAESGVVAAMLAQSGYEGPLSILEGRYGILDAYCGENDPALLTQGLGHEFEIEHLCIKKYACHVTSQASVELLRELIVTEGFSGDAIERIDIAASDKVCSHHSDAEPSDLMLAQYSLPFNTALAAFVDPIDPRVYSDLALNDGRVRDMTRRVSVHSDPRMKGWSIEMKVHLRSGAAFGGARESFTGCPERPFSCEELRLKFDRLASDSEPTIRGTLFDSLMNLDRMETVRELHLV
nr:MmgE/PrpD family protein [Microvirga antarctica]